MPERNSAIACDDLLAQGAADGEESTVAEAHTIIRADGLTVD